MCHQTVNVGMALTRITSLLQNSAINASIAYIYHCRWVVHKVAQFKASQTINILGWGFASINTYTCIPYLSCLLMFSLFLHYVGTNYSNATGCWTICVWTRNCCYVLSSSQAKSQHRKLINIHPGTFGFRYRKHKNNIIYYPERLYPERLYSNSIIYHLTLFIILQCH